MRRRTSFFESALTFAALATVSACSSGSPEPANIQPSVNLATEVPAPAPAAPDAAIPDAPGAVSESELAAAVGADSMTNAMNCVVHLGQVEAAPPDRQRVLSAAGAAWRAQLVRETNEQEAAQLVGSNANMLRDMTPALRAAAVDWCMANAPAA